MRGFGWVGEKRVRLKNKRVKSSLGQARLGSWLAASVETLVSQARLWLFFGGTIIFLAFFCSRWRLQTAKRGERSDASASLCSEEGNKDTSQRANQDLLVQVTENLLAHPLLPWRLGCKRKISLRPVYFAESNFFIIRKNIQPRTLFKIFSLYFR